MAKSRLTLTILGSGTSTGVPMIGCKCKICRSKHPRNNRLRASALLEAQGKSVLIDTSTDLRQQALRFKIKRVDAVLYTHPHSDHISGIDELRVFNFMQGANIPVFGNDWTCDDLHQKYPYIFQPHTIAHHIKGGGTPQLVLNRFSSSLETLDILGVPVTPISLEHGSKECIGYRFNSVAYVTDCSYIPPASLDRLKGLSVLVLDCVRIKPHGTHFNLEQALKTVAELSPKKTFLTHLGHDLDYVEWVARRKLPKGVSFAYDGLKIKA